jgi:hypothetical protein
LDAKMRFGYKDNEWGCKRGVKMGSIWAEIDEEVGDLRECEA